MKGMKKLLSILMVLTLVLSLGATAFAVNVTINDKGHEYTAYQIFQGKSQAADGSIGDLDWGADIDGAKFVENLEAASIAVEKEGATATPQEVAKALTGLTEKDVLHKVAVAAKAALKSDAAGTKLESGTTDLGIGYYLIVDTTESLPENEMQNDLVLEVTEDVIVTPKRDVPESKKKIKETNDTTGDVTEWQDAADYDIGDHIPFQFTGTLPDNYTSYEKYSVIFHDDQSEGLTFDGEGTVKVFVDGKAVSSGYTVVVAGVCAECEFEVKIENVKDLVIEGGYEATNDSVITVEYTSTLNEKAKLGYPGNPNKMRMEYTNKFDGSGTTYTPWDAVIAFTFDTIVNKTDGTKPLPGAGFTLLKKVNGATEPVILGEGTPYEKEYTGYVQVGDEITGVTEFNFRGLDSGEYILVETTVPDGYNKADDIEFKVKGTYDAENTDSPQEAPVLENLEVVDSEGNKIERFTVTMAPTENKGTITTDVVNQQGVTLPETGGIGTTIFYIVGAVLVAGAVILLVTKKRVSGMEK